MSNNNRKALSVATVLLGLAGLGSAALAESDDNVRQATAAKAATKKDTTLGWAAAELAAARAAEKVADANLSAALEADETADLTHDAAVAKAKANPTPANLAAVRAAFDADEAADERLTAALLADKEADEKLKAAEQAYAAYAAYAAETNGARPATAKPGAMVQPTAARQ